MGLGPGRALGCGVGLWCPAGIRRALGGFRGGSTSLLSGRPQPWRVVLRVQLPAWGGGDWEALLSLVLSVSSMPCSHPHSQDTHPE